MVINPVYIGNLEQVHIDVRRVIFECNLPTMSILQFSIIQAIPLGNHFHKKKQEMFVITEGSGKFAYLPLTADGEPQGEQLNIEIEKGVVIQVQPFTAHAFRLEAGSTMICFSTEAFDPDHPDVYSYVMDI
jgi:quercetin dioxygenase-like cupin family protein